MGSPYEAAMRPHTALPNRHRSENDGKENRKAAPTHPVRQRDLGGYIKTRQDDRPGSASENRRAQSAMPGFFASPNITSAPAVPMVPSDDRPIGDPVCA